ncbi:MAG TPA: diguanylate cyclase, partial [Candidatus Dormibacteraeota bacterium]|nr:diguanylate cyclase [Candidatus Dormibacteraeota bacterium]
DAHGVTCYLNRVRAALRRARRRDERAMQLSLGAATARPGEQLSAVIRRADAAMYAAKRRRDRTAPRPLIAASA